MRLFIILLFGMFWVTACQNPTDSNDASSGDTNKSGQPIPSPTVNGDQTPGGVLATISFDYETVPGFPPASFAMGYAYFGDNGDNAGDVSVNGNTLSVESQSGSQWYTSFSQTNPSTLSGVSFNGSVHNWQVGGAGDVPAFELGVVSPTTFTVNSPGNGTTVDISQGLYIEWSGGNGVDSMMVLLVDLDKNTTFTRGGINFRNGDVTIAKADLAGFSGDVLLQVVRYNYALHTTDDTYYVAVSEIVKQTTFTIQ